MSMSSANASGRTTRSMKRVLPQTNKPVDNPAPKRRRKTKQTLTSFIEVPMDILYEIFSNLLPFDLLKLARVNKEFRRVLMSRSSITVWQNARSNVPGLPNCPNDMSEPAYANLAFFPHCHFCLRPNVRNIDWMFRMRGCPQCSHEQILQLQTDKEDPVLALVPFRRVTADRGRVSFIVTPKDQYEEMKHRIVSMSPSELSSLRTERDSLIRDIKSHTALAEAWVGRLTENRSQELQRLKDERSNAIIIKLLELGWEKELNEGNTKELLLDQPYVREPRPLTTRVWSNIKASIINFMERTRDARLQKERISAVRRRRLNIMKLFQKYKNTHLPYTGIIPEPAELLHFEAVKKYLDQEPYIENANSQRETFDSATQIPLLLSEWRLDVQRRFLARVRASLLQNHTSCETSTPCNHQTLVEADDENLLKFASLATTVYRCSRCTKKTSLISEDYDIARDYSVNAIDFSTQLLHYPEVLGHHCFKNHETHESDKPFFQECRGRTISFENLTVEESYTQAVKRILDLIGKKPSTTTAQNLNNTKFEFYCTCLCYVKDKEIDSEIFSTPFLFNWRSMVLHVMEHHKGLPNTIALIPSSFKPTLETPKSKNEKPLIFKKLPEAGPIWECSHCNDSFCGFLWTKPLLVKHFAVRCKTKNKPPRENVDYYKTFDAAARRPLLDARLVINKKVLKRKDNGELDFNYLTDVLEGKTVQLLSIPATVELSINLI